MNCIHLIVGVHLYLYNINHNLPGLWAGPLLSLYGSCHGPRIRLMSWS